MLKKLFFIVFLLSGLLLAGCFHASINPNSGGVGSRESSGDVSRLLLSLNDTGFDAMEEREYASAEEAGGGDTGTARLLRQSGFVKGYANSFTKVRESDYQKLEHNVYAFSSAKGAREFFEILREALRGGPETKAFEVPKIGGASFGVKGTRKLEGGGASASVADYIIIFVKADVVESLDYYGLEQNLDSEEAIRLAEKAAAKIS